MIPKERRTQYASLLKKFCSDDNLMELLKEVALDDSLKKSKHLEEYGIIPVSMPIYDKLLYDLRATRKMIILDKVNKGEIVDEEI